MYEWRVDSRLSPEQRPFIPGHQLVHNRSVACIEIESALHFFATPSAGMLTRPRKGCD
jgi:hypothetical protein